MRTPFNRNDHPIPEHLHEVMNDIGRKIGAALKEATANYDRPIGFALFCFDIGAGGHMSYIANSERESTLDALEEFLRRNGRLAS